MSALDDVKLCTKCKETKCLTLFSVRNAHSKTYQSVCKQCVRAYDSQINGSVRYYKNREHNLQASKLRSAKIRSTNQALLIEYFNAHHCITCGESDPRCLQFDHRDGVVKCFSISQKLGKYNFDKLLSEMAKCDVLCANCHSKRTSRQFGWFYEHFMNNAHIDI